MTVLAAAGCGGSGSSGTPTIAVQAARTFRLSNFTPAGPVRAGKPTTVAFTILQPDGRALTAYKHGAGPHNGIHLIIVRRDLATIIHRHPPVGPGGRVSLPVTFSEPGPYRVVIDAYPKTTGPQPNFQLFTTITVAGAYKPQPLPPFRASETVAGYHVTLRGTPHLKAIVPALLDFTVTGPDGKPGGVHAVVRSARARDLLPPRLARLLPHARVRAGSDRLLERARRSEGDGHVGDAGPAEGRRARTGGRHLAALPPVPRGRPRDHGALHAARRVSRRLLTFGAVAAAALLLPAAAWAHAALLKTFPAASAEVDTPPVEVRLIYDEAVEPRFAIVSVTDAAAHQEVDGAVRRSAANVDEIDVPLKRVREGWYLVFWRAISVDGHPVRGAFTFSVGPNPGPPPQFVIPSLSETATTPGLLTFRWLTFLSFMIALGLFALRTVIARPLVARASGTSLRAVSVAFWIALAVALVAAPVYVLVATAQFALRSVWSLGALVPLMRVSAFGRGYLDLELLLALFGAAAAAALWLDRPERGRRSVAGLLSLWGALLAAGAVLLAPGASGHAAQTAPRALSLVFDWLHLGAGSIWLGGLVGLVVLWRGLPAAARISGLAVVVPRFSNVAFCSVMALLGSGIGASLLHLPTLASLWQTSYGKAILAKSALLLCAMLVASVNLLRTKPALQRQAGDAPGAARLLRRLVGVEAVLVAGAVFAAAILSSLPPPPRALASLGKPSAHTGPGPVASIVDEAGYRLELRVTPNKAAVSNDFAVRVTHGGAPVRGATVVATFTMLDMEMPTQSYRLAEASPGLYEHSAPALVMVGHWGLSFEIQPPGKQPFTVLLDDRANG